jgi:REP element-mobilizing transposase RayT
MLRAHVGRLIRELCRQHGVELLEGHALSDQVHVVLSIAPKFSVARVIGFVKGKSAVRIHRELLRERRMSGLHFWATGYSLSTVGMDFHPTVLSYPSRPGKGDPCQRPLQSRTCLASPSRRRVP